MTVVELDRRHACTSVVLVFRGSCSSRACIRSLMVTDHSIECGVGLWKLMQLSAMHQVTDVQRTSCLCNPEDQHFCIWRPFARRPENQGPLLQKAKGAVSRPAVRKGGKEAWRCGRGSDNDESGAGD
eukprot:1136733-Pelagomonas_calceolata.AAC.1